MLEYGLIQKSNFQGNIPNCASQERDKKLSRFEILNPRTNKLDIGSVAGKYIANYRQCLYANYRERLKYIANYREFLDLIICSLSLKLENWGDQQRGGLIYNTVLRMGA